jgi:CSLREA domain-containing protein
MDKERGSMRFRFAVAVGLGVLALNASAAAQGGRTFVVNTTGDAADGAAGDGLCAAVSGDCTLRAAMQEANATADLDTIGFAIGTGAQRITVGSNLPAATSPITIDGSTQPGFAGAPLIEVRGSILIGDGLDIRGGGSTLRGLVINGFGRNGVLITGGGGNVL